MLIPARKLLLVGIVSALLAFLVVPFGLVVLFPSSSDRWAVVLGFVSFDFFLLVGLLLLARRYPINPAPIFGRWPRPPVLLKASVLLVPLVIFEYGTNYALYLPLSYVAPRFVEEWFLTPFVPIISDAGSHPIAINTVIVSSVVLFGPFAEEVFFRGFLLRRFARKWTLGTGAVVASILFALPHPELPGAFCAGLILSLLYIRTRSLWAPIWLHVLNNAVSVVLLLALGARTVGLSDFQAGWPWGLAALVVGGAWFVSILRRWWPSAGEALAVEW